MTTSEMVVPPCSTVTLTATTSSWEGASRPRSRGRSEAVDRVVAGDRVPLLDPDDRDARGRVVRVGRHDLVELLAGVRQEDQQRAAVVRPRPGRQEPAVSGQLGEPLAVSGPQREPRVVV